MPNTKSAIPYAGTQEQEERLRAVIAEHKDQRGGTMPVLQAAQEIFGYLPEEVQIQIAEGLGIPLAEVYGIATFYSLFTLTPKGVNKISVCLGTACYVKGSQKILTKIEETLDCKTGSISKDGNFSVESTRCVGACGLAPVMLVNEDVYGRITPDMVDSILDKYR